jgi:hypothetical protein
MGDILRVCFLGLALLAVMLLFTPYEAVLESVIAVAFVAAVIAGFAMQQSKDVYYLKTRTLRPRAGEAATPEHDYVAIRLELVRLWLLFIPTMFAVSFMVISSARGKFAGESFLNRIAGSSVLHPASFSLAQPIAYLSIAVGMVLFFWLSERRALRNVEACSASHYARKGWTIGYQFRDEKNAYCGGDCVFFGLVRPQELAAIVFYEAARPERSRIAMGLLFHRPVVIGRGITELDKDTAAAHARALVVAPVPALDPVG